MGSLRAYCQGSGQPLLLIPGLAGKAQVWQAVVGRLADQYRIISFDHPGMGGSASNGQQSIEGILAAALDVLDDFAVENAHIVGHSTGSLVAQAIALDHPGRMKSLVLSSGWAAVDQRFRDLFQMRKSVLQHLGAEAYENLGALLGLPPGSYSRAQPPPAEDHQRYQTIMAERIDMLLNYSRASEMGTISHPTLVISSTDDWLVPPHHSRELAEAIPGADLRELSGGHFPQVINPEGYAQALREFLSTAP